VALVGAVAAALLVASRRELPPVALRVVGVAAGQGGLLVTALTWPDAAQASVSSRSCFSW